MSQAGALLGVYLPMAPGLKAAELTALAACVPRRFRSNSLGVRGSELEDAVGDGVRAWVSPIRMPTCMQPQGKDVS